MELAILDKKENRQLGRTELSCMVTFDKATPSRKEIREAIATATGADPSLLVVVLVEGSFGFRSAKVTAHSYSSKEAMSVAAKHLLARDNLAEKQKKERKSAAPQKK